MEAVAGPLAGEEQDRAFVSGMRLVAVDGMCLDLPDTPENGAEFGYPGNDAGPGPVPADPRRRPRGMRDPGGAGRGDLAAGHRGAAADPPAAGQARPRGPAAGRPELPVPRPAQRRTRRRGARAVAREKRRGPAGAGGAAGRHVAVTDRRPGRLPPAAPQGRLRR